MNSFIVKRINDDNNRYSSHTVWLYTSEVRAEPKPLYMLLDRILVHFSSDCFRQSVAFVFADRNIRIMIVKKQLHF